MNNSIITSFSSSFIDPSFKNEAIVRSTTCDVTANLVKVGSSQATPSDLPDLEQLALTQKKVKWIQDVSTGNWRDVQSIIENGVDAEIVNTTDPQGRTALMWAACANRLDVVLALRSVTGLQANATDHGGNTALILAAYAGCDQVTSVLRDSAVNASDQHGNTALILAANRNCIDVIVSLLKARTMNVNIANALGLTALHCAALANHTEVVGVLLKTADIDMNAIDENGHTALMLAAANGHLEVVNLLRADPRVDLNARDLWGRTALMLSRSHPEIVDALRRNPDVIVDGVTSFIAWTRKISDSIFCVHCTLPKRSMRSDAIPLIAINSGENDITHQP